MNFGILRKANLMIFIRTMVFTILRADFFGEIAAE